MSHNKGFTFVEVLLAIGIMAIIGTNLMVFIPKILRQSETQNQKLQLTVVANYVGNYVTRWANFPIENKLIPILAYQNGQSLILGADNRVNQLLWADAPQGPGNLQTISDAYKTSITIQDKKTDRIILDIVVWYDADLNTQREASENAVTFFTIVTEKQTL
jgi:prepilin-type N-terminal cleavage/methylation domain-containing protein